MTPGRRVLIVGGDSAIGAAAAARLETDGHDVRSTTRRRGTGRPILDFATFGPRATPLPHVDMAIIAAAVAGQGACAEDPPATVNVAGTLRLARHLAERGTQVLFLSSDKVFDGRLPRRPRRDRAAPETEYGRQKALAEAGIRARGPRGAILRLAKVLGPGEQLLVEWARALRQGHDVQPFTDMYLAPVHRDLVAEIVVAIVAGGGAGIYQLSGREEVSYGKLATRLARRLGVSADLVRPRAADPDRFPPETGPRHSALDMTREAREFGLSPTDIDEILDTLADGLNGGADRLG